MLLRFFVEGGGEAPLLHPERFADDLIDALGVLMDRKERAADGADPPEDVTDGSGVASNEASTTEEAAATRRRKKRPSEEAAATRAAVVVSGGSADESRALILESQLCLYRQHASLPHRHLYPRNGWTTLLDALDALRSAVGGSALTSSAVTAVAATSCGAEAGGTAAGCLAVCEQATHLLRFLLVESQPMEALRLVSSWAEHHPPPRGARSAMRLPDAATATGDDGTAAPTLTEAGRAEAGAAAESGGDGEDPIETDEEYGYEDEALPSDPSAVALGGVSLNVLKCLAVSGCTALLAAMDPLLEAVGAAMAAATSVAGAVSSGEEVGGAPAAAAPAAASAKPPPPALALLSEARGAVSGRGAEALLTDQLASLCALVCDQDGRTQLQAAPGAVSRLVRLLLVPLDAAGSSLAASQLRAW